MPVPVYLCAGGCGEHVSDLSEFNERGIVYPRHYCSVCVEQADKYIAERDAIHTEISEAWRDGLAEAARDFGFPEGRLPDQ